MRKTPLAHAKAHFSELVDRAEHYGERILILRHGKPAAAIVPVEVATSPKKLTQKRHRMSPKEIEELWKGLGQGDMTKSAVEDLFEGRRRLDRFG